MEYVFGRAASHGVERMTLRTKGDKHTHLAGRFEFNEVYPDCVISNTCEIDEHYRSAEDGEGNCYDWYTIRNYESKVDLSETERDALNAEIDELTEYCGQVVEQVYESDLEYVIG